MAPLFREEWIFVRIHWLLLFSPNERGYGRVERGEIDVVKVLGAVFMV